MIQLLQAVHDVSHGLEVQLGNKPDQVPQQQVVSGANGRIARPKGPPKEDNRTKGKLWLWIGYAPVNRVDIWQVSCPQPSFCLLPLDLSPQVRKDAFIGMPSSCSQSFICLLTATPTEHLKHLWKAWPTCSTRRASALGPAEADSRRLGP